MFCAFNDLLPTTEHPQVWSYMVHQKVFVHILFPEVFMTGKFWSWNAEATYTLHVENNMDYTVHEFCMNCLKFGCGGGHDTK